MMDVSLFLFVVSQECSFSHAGNGAHTLAAKHTVGESQAREQGVEGDERVAGVNHIPLGLRDIRQGGEIVC